MLLFHAACLGLLGVACAMTTQLPPLRLRTLPCPVKAFGPPAPATGLKCMQPHVSDLDATWQSLKCMQPPVSELDATWQSLKSLGLVSTVCSAGIFVLIPLWYGGLMLSEVACRKLDYVIRSMLKRK